MKYIFVICAFLVLPVSSVLSQTAAYMALEQAQIGDRSSLWIWIEIPDAKDAWRQPIKEGQTIFGFKVGRLIVQTEDKLNPRTGITEVIDRSSIPLTSTKTGETFTLRTWDKTKFEFEKSSLPKRPKGT